MLNSNDIQLGISPLSWTNDDMPELGGHIPFEQCILEMKEAGYTGCEVGNKFPRQPDELHQALQPHGLQIISQWFSAYFTDPARFDETIDQFKQHMAFLKAMNAEVIVVCECNNSIQQQALPVLGEKPIFTSQQWQALAEGLMMIGKLADDNGMKIVYHHHMGTGVQTDEEIDYLMKTTDPETVFLLIDSGHLTFAGVDAINLIRTHEKRIKHVHLKDIRSDILNATRQQQHSFLDAVKAGVFTVPGDGCIDFPSIIHELAEHQYRGWFVVEAEQDPEQATPLIYAKKAHDYLTSIIGH